MGVRREAKRGVRQLSRAILVPVADPLFHTPSSPPPTARHLLQLRYFDALVRVKVQSSIQHCCGA